MTFCPPPARSPPPRSRLPPRPLRSPRLPRPPNPPNRRSSLLLLPGTATSPPILALSIPLSTKPSLPPLTYGMEKKLSPCLPPPPAAIPPGPPSPIKTWGTATSTRSLPSPMLGPSLPSMARIRFFSKKPMAASLVSFPSIKPPSFSLIPPGGQASLQPPSGWPSRTGMGHTSPTYSISSAGTARS